MKKMLFTLPQEKVKIVALPNGMYDVTILNNEEQVDVLSGENGEISAKMYQYDGNQFRTVYELSEDEIISNITKWLNYKTDEEPTLDQLAHDNNVIQKYRSEIEEAIREAANG